MHPDVAPLVESGRISESVGDSLSTIAPGSFCLHKSWGVGEVKSWDLRTGKVVINFEKSPDQNMGIQFALQKTEPLSADDLRVQRMTDSDQVKKLVDSDPVQLIVRILELHGGTLKMDLLDREISGVLMPEDSYKKWWNSTKKALRESRRVLVPSKRSEPLVLRNSELSPLESLVEDFEINRDVKSRVKLLDAFKGEAEALEKEPEIAEKIFKIVDETVTLNLRSNLGNVLDMLGARDELLDLIPSHEPAASFLRMTDAIASYEGNLSEEISTLPSSRQRQIYKTFPVAFGEVWVQKLLSLFDRMGSRGVVEIAKILVAEEKVNEFIEHLKRSLSHQTLGSDALTWICRERKKLAEPIFGAPIASAILSVLEQDQTEDGPKKAGRLSNLLLEDRTLIIDFFHDADRSDIRLFVKKLLNSPAFSSLDSKSLVARLVKAFPETQDILNSEVTVNRSQENLVVSWESLKTRKEEYEDLVTNRIPTNIKEIATARSYGDLRENFEYKAARQMQAVLNRRKTDLERDLNRTQGTDFTGADTDAVNIGTIVTVTTANGSEQTYTILGAWDSDPANNVLSYLSEIGQGLVGKKPDDEVQLRNLETEEMESATIKSIAPYKS